MDENVKAVLEAMQQQQQQFQQQFMELLKVSEQNNKPQSTP